MSGRVGRPSVGCVIAQAAGGLRGAVRRRPVLVFAVLVLALSWPMLSITAPELSLTGVLGFFLGAGACAFLVTWLADGSAGVRELAGRALRWRAPVRWYLFALFGLPAAYLLFGYAVGVALFPDELVAPSVNGLISMAVNIVPLFLILLLGEEFGWRGFVLPRLQARLSPLVASLLVGLLWFAWHLPLWFSWHVSPAVGGIRPLYFLLPFLIGIVPYAVILTWVFNRTGGSVVLVTLMHAAGNAWNAFVYSPVFTADPVLFEYLRVGVYAVFAIALIVLTRGRLGSDMHHINGRRSGDSVDTVPPHGTR